MSHRAKMFGTDRVAQFSGQRVRPINGRMPINSDYAGKIFRAEDLSPALKLKYPNFAKDYPHGVPFNGQGYPEFSRYALKKVEIKASGIRWRDDLLANKTANLKTKPDGYTWHHHEDGKNMYLIPTDLHDAIKHSGGVSKLKGGF